MAEFLVNCENIDIESNDHDKANHLLKPTMKMLLDQQALIESKTKIKPEDDPWWSKRGSDHISLLNKPSTMYSNVQSKLYTPTIAALSHQTSKYHEKKLSDDSASGCNSSMNSNNNSAVKIDVSPSLLKPTESHVNSMWRNRNIDSSQSTDSQDTIEYKNDLYQHVQPRVFQQSTHSIDAAKWKTKEEIQLIDSLRLTSDSGGDSKKVSKVSDHILSLTAAIKNAKYVKPEVVLDEREEGWNKYIAKNVISLTDTDSPNAQVESTNKTLKVKEVSAHLLTPTASNEHSRWALNVSNDITTSKSVASIPTESHVLTLTNAYKRSVYHKSPKAENPLEKGWSSSFASNSIPSVEFLQPVPKISNEVKSPEHAKSTENCTDLNDSTVSRHSPIQVSPSLLRLTANNENSKWSKVLSEKEKICKKLDFPSRLSSPQISEHLLRPTAAVESARWMHNSNLDESIGQKNVNIGTDNLSDVKKVKSTSYSLLRPTLNNEYSKYVKPGDKVSKHTELETSTSTVEKVNSMKVRDVSDRLLKPTLNNEYSKWNKSSSSSILSHKSPTQTKTTSSFVEPEYINLSDSIIPNTASEDEIGLAPQDLASFSEKRSNVFESIIVASNESSQVGQSKNMPVSN